MGKEVIIPPLSINYKGPTTITLNFKEPKKKENIDIKDKLDSVALETKLLEPINATKNNTVTDKLIISVAKALQKKENRTYDGMTRSPQGELGICVTPALVNRALTFMDLLIRALRKRGHDLIVRSDATCVVVLQQELKIYCREKTKRVPANDKWRSHVFVPSGLLLLKLDGLYGREWVDSVTKQIEEQIPSMLIKFEEEARRLNEWKANAEQERLKRETKLKLEKEWQEKHNTELAASRILFQRAMRWEKSLMLRKYIDELEARIPKDTQVPEEMLQYIEWAQKKADWYDPFLNAADELLTDADLLAIEQTSEKKVNHFDYPFHGSLDDGNRFFPGQGWYQR
jgi:hypothetical protein